MKICRYICMLLITLVMTMFIISESSRSVKVGYDIANTEEELRKLLAENKKLEIKTDWLKTPRKMALRVENMKLNLVLMDSGGSSVAVARNSRRYQNRNRRGEIVIAQNILSLRQPNYSLELKN